MVSAAHFDVLAECITKLTGSRPSWISSNQGADSIGKQDIIDSTIFVDYDKIDTVEREEEDSQQIMIGDQDEDGETT